MGNTRERQRKRFWPSRAVRVLAAFALILIAQPEHAAAQVTLTMPTTEGRISSTFGNTGSRYHQGLDIAVPTGTPLAPRGNVQCQPFSSTAGNWAVVSHGCCVQERWLHLLSCSATEIRTDNTGSSTGPHLHWDVTIRGVRVDPQRAIGQDLCSQSVQASLIEDGRARFPNNGGGGGSGGDEACTAPNPTQQPTISTEYIPGTPATPTTPATPPTIRTTTPDGRVTTQPALSPGQPPPPLPPSVTDGLIQGGPGTNDVTGCATDTWEAMVNQAVLQTRREMAINQTLVAKADSVLAYACLERQVEHAAAMTGPIFSETRIWANRDIDIIGDIVTVERELGETSLDGALNNTTIFVIAQFLNDAFYHGWLGEIPGSGTSTADMFGGDHEGEDGEDGHDGPQLNADCGVMAQVWQLAKCLNVMDEPGWPRFEDLIETDPRQYPAMFICEDTGITQAMIDTARGAETLFDDIQPHFEYLAPLDGGCFPTPIRTGITVQRQQGAFISAIANYPDGLCITPGCNYQGGQLGGGRCE